MRKKIEDAAEALTETEAEFTDSVGRHRGKLPVRILSRVAKLGDQPELRLISGSAVATGLLLRRQRLIRAGMRMLLAHEIATAAKDFVKKRVDRTRPHSARNGSEAKPRPGRKTEKKHTSFPSGHSAGAIAVAQSFAREFPSYRLPALAAAGVVAGGQVPKRAHYPTDVAAGLIIGAASEALLALLWPAADRTRPAARRRASRPRA